MDLYPWGDSPGEQPANAQYCPAGAPVERSAQRILATVTRHRVNPTNSQVSAVLREEPLALPPHALTTLSALGLPPPGRHCVPTGRLLDGGACVRPAPGRGHHSRRATNVRAVRRAASGKAATGRRLARYCGRVCSGWSNVVTSVLVCGGCFRRFLGDG